MWEAATSMPYSIGEGSRSEIALDEATGLGATLHPALGADNAGADTLALSIDEGTIRVDALAVALEVVKTREGALARGVGALVGLGTQRVVRLDVRLEVERTSEATATDVALVTLLGVVGGLAGNVTAATTVQVGDGGGGRDTGGELVVVVVVGTARLRVELELVALLVRVRVVADGRKGGLGDHAGKLGNGRGLVRRSRGVGRRGNRRSRVGATGPERRRNLTTARHTGHAVGGRGRRHVVVGNRHALGGGSGDLGSLVGLEMSLSLSLGVHHLSLLLLLLLLLLLERHGLGPKAGSKERLRVGLDSKHLLLLVVVTRHELVGAEDGHGEIRLGLSSERLVVEVALEVVSTKGVGSSRMGTLLLLLERLLGEA